MKSFLEELRFFAVLAFRLFTFMSTMIVLLSALFNLKLFLLVPTILERFSLRERFKPRTQDSQISFFSNKSKVMVGIIDDKMVNVPIEKAIKGGQQLDKDLVRVCDIISI